jgi:hypothetical protein
MKVFYLAGIVGQNLLETKRWDNFASSRVFSHDSLNNKLSATWQNSLMEE